MIGTETPGGGALPPVALPPGLDPCTKCGREAAKPGQRWGKNCHAAYMRGYRRRRKQVQLDLLDLVGQIRAEVPGWPP